MSKTISERHDARTCKSCGTPASGYGDYPDVCDQWPLCATRRAAAEGANR